MHFENSVDLGVLGMMYLRHGYISLVRHRMLQHDSSWQRMDVSHYIRSRVLCLAMLELR